MRGVVFLSCLGLAACGTVNVSERNDMGAGVYRLELVDAAVTSSALRDQALAERATGLCGGPFQKVGETREPDGPILAGAIAWYVRCVKR